MGRVKDCPYCGGTGVDNDMSDGECVSCNGTGLIDECDNISVDDEFWDD